MKFARRTIRLLVGLAAASFSASCGNGTTSSDVISPPASAAVVAVRNDLQANVTATFCLHQVCDAKALPRTIRPGVTTTWVLAPDAGDIPSLVRLAKTDRSGCLVVPASGHIARSATHRLELRASDLDERAC